MIPDIVVILLLLLLLDIIIIIITIVRIIGGASKLEARGVKRILRQP